MRIAQSAPTSSSPDFDTVDLVKLGTNSPNGFSVFSVTPIGGSPKMALNKL